MRFRRSLAVGVAFVSLLALASSAAAIPKALINQFTGPRLIRAEVLVLASDGTVQDYRIDRGVIVGVTGAGLSVRELNGDVVPVAVSTGVTTNNRPATGGGQYHRGMRVVVYQLTGATPTIVAGRLRQRPVLRAEADPRRGSAPRCWEALRRTIGSTAEVSCPPYRAF